MNPHLQVSSDPADQVGGRSLLAALGCHTFVCADLQQQHLVQHDLPQFGGELGDELQAGGEKLPCVSKVLREQGNTTVTAFDAVDAFGSSNNQTYVSYTSVHTFIDMQWSPLAMRM